jgi:alpha-amylase/alpha-mannosidase (GH57 family)
MKSICILIVSVIFHFSTFTQPTKIDSGIGFSLVYPSAHSVVVAGDFNSWSHSKGAMTLTDNGVWSAAFDMPPGIYQYKFLVNDTLWILDPENPVMVENYNLSGYNNIFTFTQSGIIRFDPYPTLASLYDDEQNSMKTPHGKTGETLFLNIIWHQHQPSYINPVEDRLIGPWVRTHGTKDYYDMTAMLKDYPDIHVTVNLTSSMLYQIDEYYVKRLKPFYNERKNRINAEEYFRNATGTTDPWIDLALKPTSEFTEADRNYLYKNPWNAFGISEVQMGRFPEYERLKHHFSNELAHGREDFSEQEMREVKFWFYLAHFDPDFLEGAVELPNGSVVDLTDLVEKRDGKYHLRRQISEDDCNRIIAETYKVLANIIPVHRKLLYNPETFTGQVEVITTPFYHPILPLIYDTKLAVISQPRDPMPARFSYPDDARAQVARAVRYYMDIFGQRPYGMWPAEGSVAQEVIKTFLEYDIEWIATDQRILRNSIPKNMMHYYAYRAFADTATKRDDESIAIVFRDTELSDRIGFVYQNFKGEDAAEDFIRRVLSYAPTKGESPRLLTVILDGENAWEWYRYDNDGKEFLHALYRKLTEAYSSGEIITVTMSEYIHGNPGRGLPSHPVRSMRSIHRLWPGSWIHANYDTWIGEEEENNAWNLLLQARRDIDTIGIPRPDPSAGKPEAGTKQWYEFMAWESIYAAEGSDWFWWFGDDQIAPGGEEPWDEGFRTHLTNMYLFARKAGYDADIPEFTSVLVPKERLPAHPVEHIGTMARSADETVEVTFIVDAGDREVTDAIYIVGNLPELGQWNPNTIRMNRTAEDGIWSITLYLPVGANVEYKFTNSGLPGEWIPGEEFAFYNRQVFIGGNGGKKMIVRDVFGERE